MARQCCTADSCISVTIINGKNRYESYAASILTSSIMVIARYYPIDQAEVDIDGSTGSPSVGGGAGSDILAVSNFEATYVLICGITSLSTSTTFAFSTHQLLTHQRNEHSLPEVNT
jgi:hypothetical protein